MAYVLWGPFAIESDKLSVFCLDDADKATVMSRSQRRKATIKKKAEERENDRSTVRGFSTDQRINIQALNINKKRLEHQRNQTFLVGLSIQESAMSRQIESAEKRATFRCPVYDPFDIHWKIVDELIKDHSDLVKSISTKTVQLFNNERDDKDNESENTVGAFLNQPSPMNKRKAAIAVEAVCVPDDIDDDAFVTNLFKKTNMEVDDDIQIEKVIRSDKGKTNINTAIDVKKEKIKVAKAKISNISDVSTNVSSMKQRSTRSRKRKN